jgi:tyrosinase
MLTDQQLTRRQLMRAGAGGAATLTVLGAALQADPAWAAAFVRRDVGGLTATDPIIVSYANAVTAMKALPANDPRSWSYQAAIHGTTVTPALTAWNTCEHGTYYFWSWHRMYLYYFERIVRAMSGDPGWALPYWNYTSPSERQLPPMFRDPATPLYVANRNPGMNNGSSSLAASDVDYSSGFSLTDFTSASSSLEGTPHGIVHVRVGGWMGSVPTAAQDPIFYLHHCNIDRLWNLWLAQGGGRSDPLADATWRTAKFTFFDENATQVTLTGCNVLRAAAQLNHTYEGEPPQVNQYCKLVIPPWIYFLKLIYRWPIPPFPLGRKPYHVTVDIGELGQRLTRLAESRSETLFLRVEGVQAQRQPGAAWQVYLGLPDGAKPDPRGPYFVGNLALFGTGVREGSHHFMPATFSFVADGALRRALRRDPSSLSLTFVMTGPVVDGKVSAPKVASSVRVGKVSIVAQTRRRR